MSDDYPTEAELERIEKWDCIPEQAGHELMAFVQGIWYFAEWGWHRDGDDYYISTGGWSGDESIITALQQNSLFWSLRHRSTRAGGHYFICLCRHAFSHDLCDACRGTGLLAAEPQPVEESPSGD